MLDQQKCIRQMFDTWQAIAEDSLDFLPRRGKERTNQILELIIDANRVQMFGKMSDEDYKLLCNEYHNNAKWLWEAFKHA